MTNICRCGTYTRVRAGIKMAAGLPPGPADSASSAVVHLVPKAV